VWVPINDPSFVCFTLTVVPVLVVLYLSKASAILELFVDITPFVQATIRVFVGDDRPLLGLERRMYAVYVICSSTIFRDGIYRRTYFDDVLEYWLTKRILERGKFRSDTTTNRSRNRPDVFKEARQVH
jgi:hypothetical protein